MNEKTLLSLKTPGKTPDDHRVAHMMGDFMVSVTSSDWQLSRSAAKRVAEAFKQNGTIYAQPIATSIFSAATRVGKSISITIMEFNVAAEQTDAALRQKAADLPLVSAAPRPAAA